MSCLDPAVMVCGLIGYSISSRLSESLQEKRSGSQRLYTQLDQCRRTLILVVKYIHRQRLFPNRSSGRNSKTAFRSTIFHRKHRPICVRTFYINLFTFRSLEPIELGDLIVAGSKTASDESPNYLNGHKYTENSLN